MRLRKFLFFFFHFVLLFLITVSSVWAQSSGSIGGVVKDASGGVLSKAVVEISNPLSGYRHEAITGDGGEFRFTNLPFNSYHLTAAAKGFASYTQDVEVRSTVPVDLEISLKLGSASESITVEAGSSDLVETESTPHTDVDRGLFDKLPLESQSSSLSSLVTLASPGVVADSNGLFHGLGDHAENSFSVDGQPISDQQSKVFSNQIPVDSIQSMEVISGAPPAEYGDKTSLVIKVTTRSGLGQIKPTGSVTASYGSFGSATLGANVAFGGAKWGNFISANGLNTGRFLDTPEFQAIHARGNQQNAFDRMDFQLSGLDTIHLNFGYTRSWFQNPNSYDQQFHPCSLAAACDFTGSFLVNPLSGVALGPSDQRSQIKTFNIAPTWTHLIGTTAVFTAGAFVRRDRYNYYPSADPFADFSSFLQSESIAQDRTLSNAGVHSDISYVQGAHNVKAGITFQHTFLTENDTIAIIDPGVVPGFGCPDPTISACRTLPGLDLTAGGRPFNFHGHTDIKEISLYLQDTITAGNWSFNLGLRGDLYRGIVSDSQAEPRLGVAYNIKPINTVLRASYGRVQETPFNENLIIGSVGDASGVVSGALGTPAPIRPGARNDFHAGVEHAFGKNLVVSGDYMWKYTHNAYDFAILFNTPITFPIAWNNSKINGFSVRASVPNFHGVTAFFTASGVSSRFFLPQVGGLGSDPNGPGGVFRIDHDQKFQQTTHIQYQPRKNWPWIGFNWRYDNGLVAGAVPFATDAATPVDLTGLSADQQLQAGLYCGKTLPTPAVPLSSCAPSLYGSTRIKIPAPGAENDDHNPPRIASRHLFDASIGDDDLLHTDRIKWSLRLTAINLTNQVALYNFLSTFSGTHFITPRSYNAELGLHF